MARIVGTSHGAEDEEALMREWAAMADANEPMNQDDVDRLFLDNHPKRSGLEPSMNEILASIRRILSEDQSTDAFTEKRRKWAARHKLALRLIKRRGRMW
jgi:hypothetical protein